MRATALAFALTLVAGTAFAACNWSASVADKATKTTVTAEAPQQTPVPATVPSGS